MLFPKSAGVLLALEHANIVGMVCIAANVDQPRTFWLSTMAIPFWWTS